MISRTVPRLLSVDRSKNFRVSLEQLRIYKKQPKHSPNPCADSLMKLMNALEASGGKMNGPVYKYVKDVEECYERAQEEKASRKSKAGTLYYLSQYLDIQKFKKK
eukprot:CAMPEP_0113470996 /NCGR_PEP_ID=MMETSP0014_2-20120614/16744_1 /TAXON_ID=2857 /ORGANISM="Nitzschia sp." /LENGTH=104 /DNA_ID=CAMNT_0000363605 /DNA_START=27 /DNA_END=341 /DNA_ORIENTATION=+ /assembly_acc=CAM_ASM_000159